MAQSLRSAVSRPSRRPFHIHTHRPTPWVLTHALCAEWNLLRPSSEAQCLHHWREWSCYRSTHTYVSSRPWALSQAVYTPKQPDLLHPGDANNTVLKTIQHQNTRRSDLLVSVIHVLQGTPTLLEDKYKFVTTRNWHFKKKKNKHFFLFVVSAHSDISVYRMFSFILNNQCVFPLQITRPEVHRFFF
jgi:hypothetical protein